MFNDFDPEIIMGTGGYASALPLYIASKNSESIPMILQEQNSFPGITTRLFAKKAQKICIAFKQSEEKIENSNIIITGNPVRKGIEKGR